MAHVTDDEGHEDEEQGHHREGRSCPHHLCQNSKYMCVRAVRACKCGQYVSLVLKYVYSLRIFAVFSVVISISGSVKYSEATHLPFSEPKTVTEDIEKDMYIDRKYRNYRNIYEHTFNIIILLLLLPSVLFVIFV